MRWALPLVALVCGLVVLALSAAAAPLDSGQPVVVAIDESVSSSDGPVATPPANVAGDESVGTADAITVTPPANLLGAEPVGIGDAVTVTPPGIASDDESVGVSDAVIVTPPAAVSVTELVSTGDAVGVLPPAAVGPGETASVTDSVSVVPQALATTTALTAGPSPALAGTPVGLEATVTAGSHTVGSGTVTFEDDAAPLGPPVQVDASGRASLTVSSLALGTHTLTAEYSGTPAFLSSTGTASQGIYDYALSAASDRTVLRGGAASYGLTLSLVAGSATSGLPTSVALTVGGAPADASTDAPATIAFPQSAGSPTTAGVSVQTGVFELGDFSLLFRASARSAGAALHIYDYFLSLTPGFQTVARGTTATFALSSSLAFGSSTTGLPGALVLTTSPGAVAGPLALPGSTTVRIATTQATPTGPQTVSVTADPGGRTATATLVVYTARSLKQGVLARARALLGSADRHDADKLKDVVKSLSESLDPSLWVDGNHLESRHGDQVFKRDKDATKKLQELLDHGSIPAATLQAMIDALVQADQILAGTAVDDAVALQGDPHKIAQAQRELAKAATALGAGRLADAIEQYRNAWQKAQDAIGR